MLIIVEGIDRVGKTTLINLIHKKINFPIYRHIGERDFNKIDNEVETDKFMQILEICKLSESNIIFDRFHWSDFVYGCLQRNYDEVNAVINKSVVEDFLQELHAVIILVKPTDIVSSSKQHGIDLTKHEQLFEHVFDNSSLNKFACTYENLDDAVNWVCSELQKRIDC